MQPRSLNCSTAVQPLSSNTEVTVLMNQLHRSLRSPVVSQVSAVEERKRRNSENSEQFFLKTVQKRPKNQEIAPECFELYREVSGVMILDHQLRVQPRRTPPGRPDESRQNTY